MSTHEQSTHGVAISAPPNSLQPAVLSRRVTHMLSSAISGRLHADPGFERADVEPYCPGGMRQGIRDRTGQTEACLQLLPSSTRAPALPFRSVIADLQLLADRSSQLSVRLPRLPPPPPAPPPTTGAIPTQPATSGALMALYTNTRALPAHPTNTRTPPAQSAPNRALPAQ